MSKRIIKIILFIVGLASLLAFLATIKPEELISSLRAVNPFLLSIIFFLTAANISLKAMRWKILVQHIGGEKISLAFAFLSIIAGVAGGSIFPGRMEVVKPLLLKEKKGTPLTKSIPLLLAERMLDFFVIVSLLLVTAVLLPTKNLFSNSSITWAVAAVIAVVLIFTIITGNLSMITRLVIEKIPFSEKLKQKISDLEQHFLRTASLLEHKKTGPWLFLLSITAILLEIFRLHIILRTLGVGPTILITGFVFAVAVIAGIISLIPGGIGVTELSYTGILLFLIPSASSAAIKSSVLLNRFFAYYLLIIIGSIILLFYFKKSMRKGQSNTVLEDKNSKGLAKIKE